MTNIKILTIHQINTPRFVQLLELLGISQREFAKRLNRSSTYITHKIVRHTVTLKQVQELRNMIGELRFQEGLERLTLFEKHYEAKINNNFEELQAYEDYIHKLTSERAKKMTNIKGK